MSPGLWGPGAAVPSFKELINLLIHTFSAYTYSNAKVLQPTSKILSAQKSMHASLHTQAIDLTSALIMSWMNRGVHLTTSGYWQQPFYRGGVAEARHISYGCVLAFEWGNICIRQIEDNWNLPQGRKKKIVCSSPSMDNCQMSEPSSSLLSTNALTKKLAAQPFKQKSLREMFVSFDMFFRATLQSDASTIILLFRLKPFLHEAKHNSRGTNFKANSMLFT